MNIENIGRADLLIRQIKDNNQQLSILNKELELIERGTSSSFYFSTHISGTFESKVNTIPIHLEQDDAKYVLTFMIQKVKNEGELLKREVEKL